jgi:hypothetical protein
MKKLITFPPNQADEIQSFADREHEGNFSQAVRRLITDSLWVHRVRQDRRQKALQEGSE